MIISLFTAAAVASKWLIAAKIATTAGAVCIAAQPVADAYRERKARDQEKKEEAPCSH